MEKQSRLHKLRYAIALILMIGVIGISGFILLEDYDLVDAFYMTVITVTTVGFGEVQQLSQGGKIFTSLLSLGSLGTFAYAISVITTFLIESQFQFFLKGRSKKNPAKIMKNHVIVCGFGRNGRQIVEELKSHQHEYVVLDRNHEIILEHSGDSLHFLEGDATEDEVLIQAGIKNAKALISALPKDADNLFVVLTARSLNPALSIISRAENEASERKLYVAGANNVVMPERVGGSHMAKLVARPDILEFLDHLSLHGDSPTTLEEIQCSDLPGELMNKTIYEIGVRRKFGANIIGFKTPDGQYMINPTPDTIVIPNSKLFVLGTPEQIAAMKEILRNE